MHPLSRACAIALLGGSVCALSASAIAATAAGVQIKNIATVTYQDAAGNTYTAQSDEAIVTVAQVYSATLGNDVDATAAAGQIVYLPYVLTNTGNGKDTFDLSVSNGITGFANNELIASNNITIYNDANGSGEPDAGEVPISSINLLANADNTVNLVVAVEIPAAAADGDLVGITLTATAQEGTGSAVASSVTDVSAGKGRDGLDGTNESLITVTGDAVLVVTKSSTHDVANNQITYTVNVNNTGNSVAKNVVIFDGLPENTTLESSGVAGLLTSNGDTLNTSATLNESNIGPGGAGLDLNADGDITDTDEAGLALDLNTDGDQVDTAVAGIYAIDAELAPGASSSLTFTVSYDPNALGGGYIVNNTAHVSGDTDEIAGQDTLVSSNLNSVTLDADYGVLISDTGINGNNTINDGGDDDNTVNDDQFVTQVAAGGVVQYLATIQNTGNSQDIYELSVDQGNFPNGTVFTFYREDGLVQLTDTNGAGTDTGVLNVGESRTIMIRAALPTSASGDAPAPDTEYQATVSATSASDASSANGSDTMAISLGTIIEAAVDIHNAANGALGTDEDPLGNAPYSAVRTFTGSTGSTINIPLYIDNESGVSDSYALSVGSSWDGTVLGALPAGWSVEFFEGDGNGAPTGNAITNTSLIPANQLDVEIIAVVTVPNNSDQAVSNFVFDNNGDGNDDTLDNNDVGVDLGIGDGDGDYPFFFNVVSTNSGATDITLNAIDIDANRQLSLVSPGSNQVEPGNTVEFNHTLTNAGNIVEVVELATTNVQVDWTSTLRVDTDGDGVPDTTLATLATSAQAAPTFITVQQPDGVVITVTVTDTDTDGEPEFELDPGFVVPLQATVFAPADAAIGQVNTLTITATNLDPDVDAPQATLSDQITVVNGQVRLTKLVAKDSDCDGERDLNTNFATVLAEGVEPEQCAIWRVAVENQGAVDANNVRVFDAIPNFTAFEAGSLRYCLSAGCIDDAVADTVTDISDGDAGKIENGDITFYIGNASAPLTDTGGVLVPGEQATVQFSVRIQ